MTMEVQDQGPHRVETSNGLDTAHTWLLAGSHSSSIGAEILNLATFSMHRYGVSIP